MVRDGRVGVNSDTWLPPHAPAGNGSSAGYNQSGAAARMLSVGADWGADVGVVPAAANSGALRLRARGGSAPLTLVLTLADPPTDFLWQTLPSPSSSSESYRHRSVCLCPMRRSGDLTGDTDTLTIPEIQDSYYIDPQKVLERDANVNARRASKVGRR